MPYLLDLLYLGLLILASPVLAWSALRQGKYRQGLTQKLLGLAPRRSGVSPCIWLHAVSVGEVHLLQPLVQRLRRDRPDAELVISTTTKTGYEAARQKYPELLRFYGPLDFSWAVRAALTRIRPDLLVLAELELWPNLIREAHRRGTRLALVNGRLSERSFKGYARVRWFIATLLQRLDVMAVQTNDYAERFVQLGAPLDRVQITGSMKFDGAQGDRANAKSRQLALLAGIQPTDVVFLAGSTQHPEEQLALDAYRELSLRFPPLRLILVPRHPERFDEVAGLLNRSGLAWERRSSLPGTRCRTARVLLVDAMGELAAWWGLAHIGYVGGSMGTRGGQSMIEPAAYGVAISFGPRTHNFRDVVRLMLQREAAVVVQNGAELTSFVRICLEDESHRMALGNRARQLVSQQLGAADKTSALLSALLPTRTSSRHAA